VILTVKRRADIESALDADRLPLLPFPKQIQPYISRRALEKSSLSGHNLYPHLLSHLEPTLAEITLKLSDFSNKLGHAYHHQLTLDPNGVDKNAVDVLHSLLLYESADPKSLDSAFRIAAMIYMKTLMRKLSELPESSRALSQRLCERLKDVRDVPEVLLRWMSFMGLLSSSNGSVERAYFSSRLPRCSWSEIKGDLRKVLWADAIHDTVGEMVWLESQDHVRLI
jgi:hypothetical protein